MLGKIFGRDRVLIYRSIFEVGLNTVESVLDGEVTQIKLAKRGTF
jgi:hypothetical protein